MKETFGAAWDLLFAPYDSTESAIDSFAATTCSLGVRQTAAGACGPKRLALKIRWALSRQPVQRGTASNWMFSSPPMAKPWFSMTPRSNE